MCNACNWNTRVKRKGYVISYDDFFLPSVLHLDMYVVMVGPSEIQGCPAFGDGPTVHSRSSASRGESFSILYYIVLCQYLIVVFIIIIII